MASFSYGQRRKECATREGQREGEEGGGEERKEGGGRFGGKEGGEEAWEGAEPALDAACSPARRALRLFGLLRRSLRAVGVSHSTASRLLLCACPVLVGGGTKFVQNICARSAAWPMSIQLGDATGDRGGGKRAP